MPTYNDYLNYAETALAAYAINLSPGVVGPNFQWFKDAGMPTAEATKFDETWAVIEQSPSPLNGFSAVLLQNRITGEKVLAIRGTEGTADYITDLFNIGLFGSVTAMPQYQSLETFYQSLVASGKLGASESFTVTGHSLGGFLAEAFTARHNSVVTAAYTYNAPGFGGALTQLTEFLGITDASSASSKIFNIRAFDGISLTAGLGQVIGTVQQVRIEAGTANPIYYHSITTLTDTLSIYKAYSDLQPSLSMEQAFNLFVSSGMGSQRLENALDALRTVFIGSASNDINKTPTADREAFFNNLKSLTDNTSYQSLKGAVQLVGVNTNFASLAQADSDTALAYRYALLELQPFAVVANTDASNQTLYGYYTARLSLYNEQTGQGALTKAYLQDRTKMVALVAERNKTDTAGITPGQQNIRYFDADSNTQILVGSGSAQRKQFLFGGTAADTLTGQGFVDHLYGGAGNDTLNGLGGNDYLEGGKDTDTYVFGAYNGFDTVLDADGLGLLQFEGLAFSGTARKIYGQDNAWRDDSGELLFTFTNGPCITQDLLVTRYASATDRTVLGRVLVKNYQDGQLGLSLGGAAVKPPTVAANSSLLMFTYDPGSDPYAQPYAAAYVASGGNTEYTNTDPSAHWVYASGDGGQIITMGDGADFVDVARPNSYYSHWTPGAGQEEDFVSSGGGNDIILTGYGSDTISAGAGDDQIYSGVCNSLQVHDSADAGSRDVVDAGDGNDHVVCGLGGDDLIESAMQFIAIYAHSISATGRFGSQLRARNDLIWKMAA